MTSSFIQFKSHLHFYVIACIFYGIFFWLTVWKLLWNSSYPCIFHIVPNVYHEDVLLDSVYDRGSKMKFWAYVLCISKLYRTDSDYHSTHCSRSRIQFCNRSWNSFLLSYLLQITVRWIIIPWRNWECDKLFYSVTKLIEVSFLCAVDNVNDSSTTIVSVTSAVRGLLVARVVEASWRAPISRKSTKQEWILENLLIEGGRTKGLEISKERSTSYFKDRTSESVPFFDFHIVLAQFQYPYLLFGSELALSL